METQAPPTSPTPVFVQPRPVLRWLAVIVAAAGWLVSLQLLRASFGIESPLLDALCRGGEGGGNCRSVLRSQWATVGAANSLLRLPVAALGMAYFAFVGIWYLLIGTPTRRWRAWHIFILVILALGAWFSLDLLRAMASMSQWCVGCVVVHGLNGLLIVVSVFAWPWRDPARPALAHPSPRLAVAGLLACSTVFAGHLMTIWALQFNSSLQEVARVYSRVVDDPAYVRWNYERQAVVEIPSRDDGSAMGSASAPNLAVIFSDFQCSACKQAHEIIDELVRDHPDRLRVEYRHYPQDPACNPNPRYKNGGHPVACKAARAAEAALVVGGAEAFHELRRRMYAEYSQLESRSFANLAVAAGVKSAAAFDEAWYSAPIAERVRKDIELGASLGVEAVPAIYLNGRRLENWRKRETWDALLGIAPTGSSSTRPAGS